MHQVLADFSVSILELKKNPSALLSEACGSLIAVLKHIKPVASRETALELSFYR